jgi:inorganic pyrophosphatase/exopolyphosphatase
MLLKSQAETKLDDEIVRILEKMASLQPDSEEYGAAVDRLSKLHKLKSEEKTKLPSADTLLMVSANLIGIWWMTTYEKERPLTSKAISFVLKPRQ